VIRSLLGFFAFAFAFALLEIIHGLSSFHQLSHVSIAGGALHGVTGSWLSLRGRPSRQVAAQWTIHERHAFYK
jgi:hypothetical protein